MTRYLEFLVHCVESLSPYGPLRGIRVSALRPMCLLYIKRRDVFSGVIFASVQSFSYHIFRDIFIPSNQFVSYIKTKIDTLLCNNLQFAVLNNLGYTYIPLVPINK